MREMQDQQRRIRARVRAISKLLEKGAKIESRAVTPKPERTNPRRTPVPTVVTIELKKGETPKTEYTLGTKIQDFYHRIVPSMKTIFTLSAVEQLWFNHPAGKSISRLVGTKATNIVSDTYFRTLPSLILLNRRQPILYTTVVAPVVEEFVFRGVTSRFRKGLYEIIDKCNLTKNGKLQVKQFTSTVLWIVQAVLFGLLHSRNQVESSGRGVYIVSTTFMGLLLGAIEERHGMMDAISIHMLWNIYVTVLENFASMRGGSLRTKKIENHNRDK